MRVLITGVRGFDGSDIVKELSEEGYLVNGNKVAALHHTALFEQGTDQIDLKWKSLFEVSGNTLSIVALFSVCISDNALKTERLHFDVRMKVNYQVPDIAYPETAMSDHLWKDI